MKESFPGYFTPSKEQFAKLWGECLFVPDTNVLLDLYRYSPATREGLLEIFKRITERLWVPHQVVLEYLRNRPGAILTQVSMYDEAKKILEALIKKAGEDIEKDLPFRLHPFMVDKSHFLEKIKSALAEVGKELDEQKQKHPDLIEDDSVLEALDTLLDGKVGEPYPPQKLADICKEGEARYRERTPPGYSDAEGRKKKEGRVMYGDLILWFQTIDRATETKKPIILITNETTEDWWWIPKGKTIGPRPELIAEMEAKAKVGFYAYNSDRFMSFAQEYLKASVKQEAINEVQEVRQYDADKTKGMPSEWMWRTLADRDSMDGMVAEWVRRTLADRDSTKRTPIEQMIRTLYPGGVEQAAYEAVSRAALATQRMNRIQSEAARSAKMPSEKEGDSGGDSLDSFCWETLFTCSPSLSDADVPAFVQ